MKKLFFPFALLFLASTIFIGCGSDPIIEPPDPPDPPPPPPPVEYIVVEGDVKQEVYADEETAATISFTTLASWTASVDEEVTTQSARNTAPHWITIYPKSGEAGQNEIEITLEQNTTGADRSVIITITSGGGYITITITQRHVTADGDPLLPPKGVNLHGVIWALSNVDAPGTFAENPQDFGQFFQWNDPVPITAMNQSHIATAEAWEKENDPCPEGWRVPTEIEFYSLFASESVWTENYNGTGVAGRIFGTEPNTVFLPAAGLMLSNGERGGAGIQGAHWSATSWVVQPQNIRVTPGFQFGTLSQNISRTALPFNGFKVRCVRIESEYIPTPFITQGSIVPVTIFQNHNHTFSMAAAWGHGCTPDVITHQWQQSSDGVNWVNAQGESTNVSFTTPALTESTYFRRQASDACGNTIVTAAALVTVIPFPTLPTGNEGVVINGVRWATRNVNAPGTFVENIEDAGMFYQWGSRTGWSSTDPLVNSDGDTSWWWINNSEWHWESANDPCPDGWRVPTYMEFRSLLDVNLGMWGTLNGVEGRIFGTAPNQIFLPIAGWRPSNGVLSNTQTGYYWSTGLAGNLHTARGLMFTRFFVHTNPLGTNSALSVRCVEDIPPTRTRSTIPMETIEFQGYMLVE